MQEVLRMQDIAQLGFSIEASLPLSTASNLSPTRSTIG
jgi:hypothetical protein